MNKNLFVFTRRLVALFVVVCLTAVISISDAAAQKPDFAGKAAEEGGRSDDAKKHAKERGKGKKKGLNKETDKKDDESDTGEKKAEKDEKDKKAKKAKKDKKSKK